MVKHLLAGILAVFAFWCPVWAQNELPSVISDKPISDNFDYLYEQVLKLRSNITSPGTYLGPTTDFSGDVTGKYNSMVVGNDSHTHGDGTLTGLAASKLTGALPALDGSALTGVVHTTATLESILAAVQATISTAAYTNGSYANPAWITSLASSKLTGTIPAGLVDLSTVTTALADKLTAPATFYIVKPTDYLTAPATFTYQSPGAYITSLTGAVTATGPGAATATIVSVPQGAVNLSTVTASHVLKAGDTMTGTLSISSSIVANEYQIAGSTVMYVRGGNNESTTNVYLGYGAGEVDTLGASNTFLGHWAGKNNPGFGATQNTFVGNQSGFTTNSGGENTFIGVAAGYYNSVGYGNTFVGKNAGSANDGGIDAVVIGMEAGGVFNSAATNVDVSSSVLVGWRAGYKNTTGTGNTVLGYSAGYANTTGGRNIHIGYATGSSNTTGSRNIIIGNDVEAPAAGTNDYLNIGGLIVGDIAEASATVRGSLSANTFYGSGAGLIGVPGDNFGNHIATMTITAGYGLIGSTASFNGSVTVSSLTVTANATINQSADGAVAIKSVRKSDSGSGTGYFQNFYTANGATSIFRVDTAGNTATGSLLVGVGNGGTINPNYIITAGDQTSVLNTQGYKFQQYATTGGSLTFFSIEPKRDNAEYAGYNALLVNATESTTGAAGSYLLNLQRNSVSKLVVQSDGKVGIGTSSPGNKLDIRGSANGTGIKISRDADSPLAAGDYVGIDFSARNSGDYLTAIRSIQKYAAGAGEYLQPRLGFFTQDTYGDLAEKMSILDDGKVGIGDTTPSYSLDVVGDVNITGSFLVNGSAAAGTGNVVLASTQTFTGTNSFTSLSTMTISGTVDIGWERITGSAVASGLTCSCTTGKVVFGGGCGADGTTLIQNSYPNGNSYYCSFSATTNARCYAICARVLPH